MPRYTGWGLILLAAGFGCQSEELEVGQAKALIVAPLVESGSATRNPERGFINMDYVWPTRQADTQSMTRYLIDLSAKCNDSDVSTEVATLVTKLNDFRAQKKQLIVRLVYSTRRGYGNGCGTNHRFEPASFAILQAHLDAFGAAAHTHADAIAAWEAGILGPYGEWHSWGSELVGGAWTSLYDEGQMLQAGAPGWGNVPSAGRDGRLTVLRLLLDRIPTSIPILVRRPVFHLESDRGYGTTDPGFNNLATGLIDVLSTAERARLGFHNDCYLSSDTDYATYAPDYGAHNYAEIDTVAESKAYVAAHRSSAALGGEICWPQPSATHGCTDVLTRMEAEGINFLNRNYYQPPMDTWMVDGCFDEIEKRLGYRFVARSVDTTTIAGSNPEVEVNVSIDNTGFGTLMRARSARIQLVRGPDVFTAGTDLTVTSSSGTEAQAWSAGLQHSFHQRFVAPSAPGVYRVRLLIPDTENNPDFAVALSNTIDDAEVFSPVTGSNDLGIEVTLGGQCTPLTCWAEACGPQADGCGGSLDCGACPGAQPVTQLPPLEEEMRGVHSVHPQMDALEKKLRDQRKAKSARDMRRRKAAERARQVLRRIFGR